MIPENVSPSMFARVPPASLEDAAARISELIPFDTSEGDYHERFIGVVFQDSEQIFRAFREAGFFVTKIKKPIVNTISITEWLHLVSPVDGREFDLLINTMGFATIINAVKISGPKI
jgi:hypothetical protein